MRRKTLSTTLYAFAVMGLFAPPLASQTVTDAERAACAALADRRDLTLLTAAVREDGEGRPYCYVRGIIAPAIGFHVQLPLRDRWNGRFLMYGDGGKDGDLDFADHRVAEGYAVANTNLGHDNAIEPGSSFALDNRQSEIDFGYRAVHLTTVAGKAIVDAYYDRAPEFSYFEGCSTGGREGLMEAQRYAYDFDGIVAGAPAHLYQDLNVSRTWLLQRMYLNDFAGSLSFDTDGDGLPDSVRKVELLRDAVLEKCDAIDGIRDGVLDDPTECDFDPTTDLAGMMCPGDVNGDACFTRLQLQHVQDFYRGAYDSRGNQVYRGHTLGSEPGWMDLYIPHAGNRYRAGALGITADHLNYLFYEDDPGTAPPDLADLSYVPSSSSASPEWAWWQFDIDDTTAGKGDLMKGITDANDPDLTRFLRRNEGKLILYHGWSDPLIVPGGTVDYYEAMVDATFGGDMQEAREHVRLFMIPSMGHCGGGPGPNDWDKLPPLVEWVERGTPPEAVIATHRTNGVVDNERPIYPYPDRAVYAGPAGGQDDPANWVAENFRRR
jgi:feruloyl esterase